MQTISSNLKTAIQTAKTLKASVMVVAEWNLNRFATISKVANAGSDVGFDPDTFPIASIAEPWRPRAGMPKAFVGEAKTYSVGASVRWHTIGVNSLYKYWASDGQSSTSSTASGYAITGIQPYVLYTAKWATNKIRVGFETGNAKPQSFVIETTTDGTTWTTVATNPTIDSDGRVTLYLQSDGTTWGATVYRGQSQMLMGVRVTITHMDTPSVYAEIIEVSPRLEKDLSADVINAEVSKMLSDQDVIVPVGKAISDSATVTLDNSTGAYNYYNTSSPYYGLLLENARFQIFYGIDTTDFGGAGVEYVSQGIFWANQWSPQSDYEVQLQGQDASKFFQKIKMPNVLFTNKSGWDIIQQICDLVGFNDYIAHLGTVSTDYKIPYVWFKNDTLVWDAFQQIATACQAALTFDENGYLHWKSRDYLFDNLTPVDALSSVPNGSVLPNVISVSPEFNTQVNKVTVRYQEAKITQDRLGKPIDNVLWAPTDETISLQSAILMSSITATQTTMVIDNRFATTWPYTGYANIEGEIIYFEGKEYKYRQAGVVKYGYPKSAEERDTIDASSDLSTMNTNMFTGKIIGLKRGQMNTPAVAHGVDIGSWTGLWLHGTASDKAQGVLRHGNYSTLDMFGPAKPGRGTDFYVARRGTTSDAFHVAGTRVRFAALRYSGGSAGIFMHMPANYKEGYFFEINTSYFAGRSRKHKEVRCYRRYADGTTKPLPTSKDFRGFSASIAYHKWYDLEVTWDPHSHQFGFYVNGRLYCSFADPYGSILTSGTWGTFIRGNTIASFEYFYGVTNPINTDLTTSTILDHVTGDYVSGYIDQEVILSTNSRNRKYFSLFFDDFGPYVHEVRKFDVNFDKFPAYNSKPYVSNQTKTDIAGYNADPFSATLLIANTTRSAINTNGTAIIQGDDPLFSPGQTVRQQIMVYGQAVQQGDEKTVVVQDDVSVQRQGAVELEFQTNWIQTEASANALGKWITQHWSTPADTISLEAFLNPAWQIGDVVSVTYPALSMSASTHVYHITAITAGFDAGFSCNLTLRRAR